MSIGMYEAASNPVLLLHGVDAWGEVADDSSIEVPGTFPGTDMAQELQA